MSRRRVDKGAREKALALVREGKTNKEAGEAVGVTQSTVQRWTAKAGLTGPAAEAAVQSAPAPEPSEGPVLDAEGDGGAEAALEAAGPEAAPVEAPRLAPPQGGPQGAPQGAPAGTAPPDPGAALVQIADGVLLLATRLYAARSKVPWTPALERQARLSKAERDTLGIFAPQAAPFVLELVKHSDKIAAAVFAGAFGLALADRLRLVKGLAPAAAARKVDAEVKDVPPAKPGKTEVPRVSIPEGGYTNG